MKEILGRIDNVLAGDLCPCGAPPAPGSAYCGDDCTPTHLAVHTDRRETGDLATPMRWRPDLVSAADDSRRRLLAEFRRGELNAQVYEYADSDSLHLRLDDGVRYVGGDLDAPHTAAAHRDGAWRRLEREFANSRHLEPDPGADVVRPRQRPEPWRRRCLHCGESTEPRPSMRDLWSDRARPHSRYLGSERCDACRNCGTEFPGPPLRLLRTGDPPAFRMRIGAIERFYQFRDHELTREIDPVELVRRRLERMEADLLFAYAQANFSRPDVREWVRAYTEKLIRA